MLSYRLVVESTANPVIRYCPFFSASLTLSAVEGSLLIRQKQKKQVDPHYFLPRKTSLWGACKSWSHCSCKQFRASTPSFPRNLYFLQGHNMYSGVVFMLAKTANFSSLMTTFATQIAAVWLPSREMLSLRKIRRFSPQVLCMCHVFLSNSCLAWL